MSTTDFAAQEEGRSSDRRPDEFLSAVYTELRRLANMLLGRTGRTPSLPATALVHEAYVRLCESPTFQCHDEQHFLSVAARVMRQILVDRQRSRRRLRRGGARRQVSLDHGLDIVESDHLDLIALDDSLRHLERIDPSLARIVELRFFAGLSVKETAALVSISAPTVKRQWRLAKAWLHQEISDARSTRS